MKKGAMAELGREIVALHHDSMALRLSWDEILRDQRFSLIFDKE